MNGSVEFEFTGFWSFKLLTRPRYISSKFLHIISTTVYLSLSLSPYYTEERKALARFIWKFNAKKKSGPYRHEKVRGQ